MKQIAFLLLFSLLSVLNYAQIVINNPVHGFKKASSLSLTKIESSDTATILSFTINYPSGGNFTVPKGTYLKPNSADDSNKIYAKGTIGIPFGKRNLVPEAGVVSYAVVFPSIDASIKSVDYGEDGGNWYIYDIALSDVVNKSAISATFSGNWFDMRSSLLKVAFLSDKVIYNSRVWTYETSEVKKKKASYLIKNGDETVRLKLMLDKLGHLNVTEGDDLVAVCTKDIDDCNITAPDDNTLFEAPVLKSEDAILSGYIAGYTPRVGFKTMSLFVNDILTGQQNGVVIDVNEDGTFSTKIPLYYPHETFFRSDIHNGTCYLEPGKELFMFFDNNSSAPHFMGEGARLASDFLRLGKVDSYNYKEMRKRILDMDTWQYKTWLTDLWQNAHAKLDTIIKEGKMSAKATQVERLCLDYRYADRLMDYKYNYEKAYRKKHKIPRKQRKLPITVEPITKAYADFLTSEMVNNPMAYLTTSYGNLVNTMKYYDGIRVYARPDLEDELAYLKAQGVIFSESEQKTIEAKQERDKLMESEEYKTFVANSIHNKTFWRKYRKLYKEQKKDDNSYELAVFIKYLQACDSVFSSEEASFVDAYMAYKETPLGQQMRSIWEEYGDSINVFQKRYAPQLKDLNAEVRLTLTRDNLQSNFDLEPGQFTDIMMAQDMLRPVVTEYKVWSDKALGKKQSFVSDSFVKGYLAECNQATKEKIEKNKTLDGYTANDVPKTDPDKVFEAIMAKYEGKVIYVDFWATWCGPCRSEMKKIAPFKEEMKDKEVAFVYISAPSSPIGTYENMIPTIKGEHYRVSQEEWDALKKRFNITGIPHFAMVNKSGQVVSDDAPRYSNPKFKQMIQKYMAE